MKVDTSKKAFTLIELMVVMAIIGVLAIYLVPQLVGAQARSRDAGRVASLKSISAVLETYNSDEGTFPNAPHPAAANGCLSGADGEIDSDLADLFKGGRAPVDPQRGNNVLLCTGANGLFGYASLVKDGISDGGYILVANVETTKKANLQYDTITLAIDGTTDYDTIKPGSTGSVWGKIDSQSNSQNEVYAEMN